MRVYLPATTRILAQLSAAGTLEATPITAFAVTPALREWYLDDDVEELEYAASMEAARASLRLIATAPGVRSRRVVIAADAPDTTVSIRDDLDRGVVRLSEPVQLAACASVHIDDAEAEPVVARAAQNIDAADLGDPEAEQIVDDAEGFELSWYATQEIDALLAKLDE